MTPVDKRHNHITLGAFATFDGRDSTGGALCPYLPGPSRRIWPPMTVLTGGKILTVVN